MRKTVIVAVLYFVAERLGNTRVRVQHEVQDCYNRCLATLLHSSVRLALQR